MFNDSFTFRWASPGFAMWFLLVLFIYNILFPVLIKIKYIFPISVVVSLLIGFIPTGGIVSRIFCFFPFYLLGYYVNNSKELETIKRNILQPFKFKDGLVLSVLTILWATILYFKPGIAYFTTFTQNYNGDWLLLFVRLALYLSAIVFGYYVLKIFPNKKTFYTKYGERTMGVYLFHGFIVLPIAYKLFEPLNPDDYFLMSIKILLPVLLSLFLFSKPVNNIVKKIF